MFQQRHFEAIARMMQDLKAEGETDFATGARLQWGATCEAMCDLFSQHNPNFDRERFKRACEPGANVKARRAA